jgi:hypothetical protein
LSPIGVQETIGEERRKEKINKEGGAEERTAEKEQ